MSKKQLSCADTTRTKILTAAQAVFMEYGYAGATIKKIAAAAQINHSLIFHHFNNKRNLWSAVKMKIVASAEQDKPLVPSLTLNWSDFIRELFVRNIDFYRHSNIIYLINWQRIESQQCNLTTLPQSKEMSRWTHAIQHYQAQGDINRDFDPTYVVRMICSLCSSAAWDQVHDNSENDTGYIDFCIKRLQHTLR